MSTAVLCNVIITCLIVERLWCAVFISGPVWAYMVTDKVSQPPILAGQYKVTQALSAGCAIVIGSRAVYAAMVITVIVFARIGLVCEGVSSKPLLTSLTGWT